MKRHSQSGVALVITLVLLSVITFMAVTFLVVSRHEGAQVNTLTQQSNAKFAADAASEQAKALIAAQMLANNNGFNFGLLVSTNYINATYFPGKSSITNVSYNGITSVGDLEQMLTNLLILPRAPVFIVTNKAFPNNPDFRFYLDLNRNGRYDTNGWVPERDFNGNVIMSGGNPLINFHVGDPEWIGVLNHPEWPHSASNFFVARYCFIALPIGNSLDLNYIHNQSQELDGAGSAIPIGDYGQDQGYLRNQGVGSWEINLAGFLAALNTNTYCWPASGSGLNYSYYPENPTFRIGGKNGGNAFNDAAAIVQYRYIKSYQNQNVKSFRGMYPDFIATPTPSFLFANDGIDGYSIGPLMTNFGPLSPLFDRDNGAIFKSSTPYAWSGADNPSPLFTTQDLFGTIPSPPGSPLQSFTNRLYSAGRPLNLSTYDQYTYYRMLSQLSVGSAAEVAPPLYTTNISVINGNPVISTVLNTNYSSVYANLPKMNLNYNNVGTNLPSAAFVSLNTTNFVPWTPVGFFTNAADRMLRAYFPNPIVVSNADGTFTTFTNSLAYGIPVYPVNLYTPAVHRVLQLAANMFDSVNSNRVDNTVAPVFTNFPSVFRPIFTKRQIGTQQIIYITGYAEVTNFLNDASVAALPKDLRRPLDRNKFQTGFSYAVNVYGVPYIIGARTGFPTFNKFVSAPTIQLTRKLEVVKPSTTSGYLQWHTNAQYTISVSNAIGVECWYSSTSNYYGRDVTIYATDDYSMQLTNDAGILLPTINNVAGLFSGVLIPTNISSPIWTGSPSLRPGYAANSVNSLQQIAPSSFQYPLVANLPVQGPSTLLLFPPKLPLTATLPGPVNFETTPGYYTPHFGLLVTNRVRVVMVDRLTQRIIDYVELGSLGGLPGVDTTDSIIDELQNVYGGNGNNQNPWSTNTTGKGVPYGFFDQISVSEGPGTPPSQIWTAAPLAPGQTSVPDAQSKFAVFMNPAGNSTALTFQAPYVATADYQMVHIWTANDPLVHYTSADLHGFVQTNQPSATNVFTNVMGRIKSDWYQPWGITNIARQYPNLKNNQMAYKDPLIGHSDSWQFLANKFANVGWLGRVHRGTPWQTVYLKPAPVDPTGWANWTGDTLGNYYGNNYPWDSQLSSPTNDWILMDLFTAAPNDNATRGQLSVNQTNLAAWAAVLDGVVVVSNAPAGFVPWIIDPNDTFTAPGTTYLTNKVQYIVNSINAFRANTNANLGPVFPGGVFSSLGQILSVPQLTVSSPYLDFTSPASSLLNDEAYERIPQQVMSLLRLGTPRYVIFAYGQSLKPADHSIVQSGGSPFFGMCTNYQITGEVATRTVVKFGNQPVPGTTSVSSPQAVVESFNVLGPE